METATKNDIVTIKIPVEKLPVAYCQKPRALYIFLAVQLFLVFGYLLFTDHSFLKERFVFLVNIPNTESPKSTVSSSYATSTSTVTPTPTRTTTPEPDPSCGYLVRHFWDGRLGSQMFVYASFFGQLMRFNTRANKTAFIRVSGRPSSLDGIFEDLSIPQKAYPQDWFKRRNFTTVGEKYGCCSYDSSGLEKMQCDSKNLYITGYRSNYQYFAGYEEQIKKEFTFKPRIRDMCYQRFNQTLNDNNMDYMNCITVGVHLRRGDFARNDKMNFGHMPAKFDYLQRAVRYFETLTYINSDNTIPALLDPTIKNDSCLAFLIFGNDFAWNINASLNLELLNPRATRLIVMDHTKSEPALDLCMMSLCEHQIISAGTFSWWAGFFSRGIVVHQKEFARVGSMHYKEYNPDQYFPKHWIAL